MRVFKSFLTIATFAFFALGCKKEIIENRIYDNVIFDLDTLEIYPSNTEKTKQKSNDQYISILYADLFNRTISSRDLLDLSELTLAVGDNLMINQLVMSSFLNEPDVVLQTNSEMRNDLDQFMDDIYIRFYLRYPTAYERVHLKEMIENDPGLTPDLIYSAFALSNEYYFY